MSLVETAAATGAATPYDGARVMAFNLYGQGVAFFQSVQILIAGSQPVEALPSLRGLALISARFEQSNPEGAGLGIALDSISETGAEGKHIEQARRTVHQVADQVGIVIPGALPDPKDTVVYRSAARRCAWQKVHRKAGTGLSAFIFKSALSSRASTQSASPTRSRA